MLVNILNDDERRLFGDVREVTVDADELVRSLEGLDEERTAVGQALRQLERPFMLVVAGEFNSGKSSLLNALLGDLHLDVGVTPTTSAIHVLHHGENGRRSIEEGGVVQVTVESPLLRDIELVDSPGTNAIDRRHEALTREFLPRCDLLLFVTSADRPFTESERRFLEGATQWGKKVVLVVNKIDILSDPAERSEVLEYVRRHGQELLGVDVPVFSVSARQALEGTADAASGTPELAAWLQETLDEDERVRLKLRSPLGVVRATLHAVGEATRARREDLIGDLEALVELDAQSDLHREDLRREFELRLGEIDLRLHEFEARGGQFFDDTLRLARLRELLRSDRLQARFEREVTADLPQRVEEHVSDLIDWMVDQELRRWQQVQKVVVSRLETHGAGVAVEGPTQSRRAPLLRTLGEVADNAVRNFDRSREASRLGDAVKRSLAGAAALEVGAVGLGAAVALAATTTAVDVTGLLTAGAMAALGLLVLPARRRQAKRELASRLAALRSDLMGGLRQEFETELERGLLRIGEATAPYRHHVGARRDVLEARSKEVERLEAEVEKLDARASQLRQGTSGSSH